MAKKIIITGGTGLIGTHLTKLLIQKGYTVAILTRNPEAYSGDALAYKWDIAKGYIDPEAFKGSNCIIHLAGAAVADKRWTPSRKEIIINSRVDSAQLLYNWLSENNHIIEAFISASGISYYKQNTGQRLSEEAKSGNNFLAEVTKVWENSAENIKSLGIRTVIFRIGIVLSDKGGALVELAKPVRLGAAAPLGTGKQTMSWVHVSDLCRMFIFATENLKFEGIFNAVAPHPVTNREFIGEVAKVLNKVSFLPAVPSFVLKIILGERAEMVLDGANVSSEKLETRGFAFEFPKLTEALRDHLV